MDDSFDRSLGVDGGDRDKCVCVCDESRETAAKQFPCALSCTLSDPPSTTLSDKGTFFPFGNPVISWLQGEERQEAIDMYVRREDSRGLCVNLVT